MFGGKTIFGGMRPQRSRERLNDENEAGARNFGDAGFGSCGAGYIPGKQ